MHASMINWGKLLAICAVFFTGILAAQQPDSTFWVPNGPVNSLLLRDTTVILGGDFDQLSPVTGSFIRLDPVTAQTDPSLFKVNGPVYATTRDNNGYIYVGGNFSRVGNQQVGNLFRLNPNGTFDYTFTHLVHGTVYALQVQDSGLYIGGAFTGIDGETRSNFGGINLNTGQVNDCDPGVNGPVYCMDVDSFTSPAKSMVIGGNFSNVFGYNPPFLAKILLTTGAPFTFNAVPWTVIPNTNGPVYDVDVAGGAIYIGGAFTMFGAGTKKGFAVMDRHFGTLSALNANVQGAVYAFELTDSAIYLGGNFSSVDNQARNNLAKVDLTFDVQSWNPGADGDVRVIERIDNEHFFVGGDFGMAGGDTCRRAAIIDTAGMAGNWNPVINAPVRTVVWDQLGRMYVGGEFFGAGGVLRNNLCALSVNSGTVTAWNPDVNALVSTMTLDGDSLYFAGNFTMVGGIARGRMAAIDLQTETLLPFNPIVNGLVRTIAITGSEVYAGGNFTSFGGQARGNIGKVDKSTGLAVTWHPNCLGTVNSILVTPHWIYVAGFYSTISGVTRHNLSRLHPQSAVADLSWICHTDDGIYHAEFYNNSLVLTGWFDMVNTQFTPDFAIVDTTSLQAQPMNFTCDGFGRTFTRYGDDLFISGMFEVVNATYHPHLVSYDAGDGAIDTWAPFPDAEPLSMQATATHLFIGGGMSTTGGRFHPNFQVLPIQWVTAIDETNRANTALQVFPNPTSDNITVNSVENFSAYTVTDVTGQIVMTGIVSGATLEISLAELASGIYVLSLKGETVASVSQTVIRQ